jgi:hypothetical protein
MSNSHKKKQNIAMKNLVGLLILSFALFACSSDDSQNARLEIRLTDAPGDYEQVNVDIQGIEIHTENGDVANGWKSLNVENGVYNLLELTNGMDTLIAAIELPAGKISQVRLLLGQNNSVKIDGKVLPMATPSAQQSGLKLNVHADLLEGITYKMLLDFDAARSVVNTGAGTFNLKPVIRSITEATSGAIKGEVNPAESLPAVFALAGADTVATTYADSTGKFLLRGVPAGTYTVSIDAKEGYNDYQESDVNVTVGSVTDIGTISLQ